jgi:hypothetical protein
LAITKQLLRWAFCFLWPFASALPLLFYIHLVQLGYALELFSSLIWLPFLFVPVVFGEFLLTRHFFYKKHSSSEPLGRLYLHFAGNILIWLAFYSVWCGFVAVELKTNPAWKMHGPYFFSMALLLWRFTGWLALIALAYWVTLYGLVVVRLKRFRLALGVMAFFPLTLLFFFFQWHWGGTGKASSAQISFQLGVSQVMDYREISAALRHDRTEKLPFLAADESGVLMETVLAVLREPRGIHYEPTTKTLYTAYGSTYLGYDTVTYPVVVSKNFSTGQIIYRLSSNLLFDFSVSGPDIVAAPFIDSHIYLLSKNDLSITSAIPVQGFDGLSRYLWNPISVFWEHSKSRFFVLTHLYPRIQAYDSASGKIVAQNVFDKGRLGPGKALWAPVQCPQTKTIYALLWPDRQSLLELDADTLQIKRTLNVECLASSAMALDPGNRQLFIQHATSNTLVRVDLETWSIDRRYKGLVHARDMVLDSKRNALYLLGYGQGTLLALDLETGKRVWKLKVGARPNGLDLKDDALWVNSRTGAFQVDLPTVWANAGR